MYRSSLHNKDEVTIPNYSVFRKASGGDFSQIAADPLEMDGQVNQLFLGECTVPGVFDIFGTRNCVTCSTAIFGR